MVSLRHLRPHLPISGNRASAGTHWSMQKLKLADQRRGAQLMWMPMAN
jgi:hypothetical protein